jgi:hypothetical protein
MQTDIQWNFDRNIEIFIEKIKMGTEGSGFLDGLGRAGARTRISELILKDYSHPRLKIMKRSANNESKNF